MAVSGIWIGQIFQSRLIQGELSTGRIPVEILVELLGCDREIVATGIGSSRGQKAQNTV